MFSWGPASRCCGAWTALAVLALVMAAGASSFAAPWASAQGPSGGYHAPPGSDTGKAAGGNGLAAVRSALQAPLRWLRQSGRSFQGLMGLLAERSAHVAGKESAPAPPPPQRPRKEPVEEEEEPPRQSVYGGEAGAGRDQGAPGVRVREWHKRSDHWPRSRPVHGGSWEKHGHDASCRRAGLPVPRGSWYVVQRGDTLWHIAEMHFGYGEAYARLRHANSGRVPDADLIFPCQRLYIPRWRCCGFSSRADTDPPGDGHEGVVGEG